MINWLRSIWQDITGGVSAAIQAFVNAIVSGICWVLDFIFGNVKGAWSGLAGAWKDSVGAIKSQGEALYDALAKVFGYYIPTFAMTAWWWVTHPGDLALVMFWWTVHWLEHFAWDAGHYLGEFTLALLLRNIQRVALMVETIVAAVL